MARSIWSGTISFGLLNVPVKLYSAVAKRSISLREIRESDSSRIRHKRVSEADGEEVPYESIQKAYEISSGNYVPLTKDELADLEPAKTRTIEISDFVDIEEIDPIYFVSPYYLGPAEGAEKAYSLLVKAMSSAGKAAIAQFVFRNKQHLAAIRPADGALTMTTMRFSDEVVPVGELEDVIPSEAPKISKKEVDMAESLIESLSTAFDPTAYSDSYREALMNLIETKAEGKEVVVAEAAEPEATAAPDLMAALEESIAAVRGAKAKKKPPAKKPPAKGKASTTAARSKPKAKAKAAPRSRAKSTSKS